MDLSTVSPRKISRRTASEAGKDSSEEQNAVAKKAKIAEKDQALSPAIHDNSYELRLKRLEACWESQDQQNRMIREHFARQESFFRSEFAEIRSRLSNGQQSTSATVAVPSTGQVLMIDSVTHEERQEMEGRMDELNESFSSAKLSDFADYSEFSKGISAPNQTSDPLSHKMLPVKNVKAPFVSHCVTNNLDKVFTMEKRLKQSKRPAPKPSGSRSFAATNNDTASGPLNGNNGVPDDDKFRNFWKAASAVNVAKSFNPPIAGSGLKAEFEYFKSKCVGFGGGDSDLVDSPQYKECFKDLKKKGRAVVPKGSRKKGHYIVQAFGQTLRLKTNRTESWYYQCFGPNCWQYGIDHTKPCRCVSHALPREIIGRVAMVKDEMNKDSDVCYVRFVPRTIKQVKAFFKRELYGSQKKVAAITPYEEGRVKTSFTTLLYNEIATPETKDVYLHTISVGMEMISIFQHPTNTPIQMLSTSFLISQTNVEILSALLADNGIRLDLGPECKHDCRSPMVDHELFTTDLPFEYKSFGQPGALYHGECLYDRREGKYRSETHKRRAAKNISDNMVNGLDCDEDDVGSIPSWQMFDFIDLDFFKPEYEANDEKLINVILERLQEKNNKWYTGLPEICKVKLIEEMQKKVQRQETISILVKVVGSMLGAKVGPHSVINRNKKISYSLGKLTNSEMISFERKFEHIFGRKIIIHPPVPCEKLTLKSVKIKKDP